MQCGGFALKWLARPGVALPDKGEGAAAQNTAHPILAGDNTIGIRKIFYKPWPV